MQGLLAETYERVGNWQQVESHYKRALVLTPKDYFLLDRGRAREVLALLADSSQSDTAFLRLALAEAALHSPELPLYT